MAGTRHKRIGALVLVFVGVGLLAAAFFAYTDDALTNWWSYSSWTRRWILFIGLVLIGILARIILRRDGRGRRNHANRDAASKT
jgi:threonine/homoserine/homoserine lactone efflux protein